MVIASDVAAQSLADAPVEAIAYACLVAVLARGPGAHRDVQARLERRARGGAAPASGGDERRRVDRRARGTRCAAGRASSRPTCARWRRSSPTTCARRASTSQTWSRSRSPTTSRSGGFPSDALVAQARRIAAEQDGLDALVLSACVQMPSLAVVEQVERRARDPGRDRSDATARALFLALGLEPVVPGAGSMLAAGSGARGPVATS